MRSMDWSMGIETKDFHHRNTEAQKHGKVFSALPLFRVSVMTSCDCKELPVRLPGKRRDTDKAYGLDYGDWNYGFSSQKHGSTETRKSLFSASVIPCFRDDGGMDRAQENFIIISAA